MTFAILIEIPELIKKELSRICFGLPTAQWQTEENIFINLHLLKKLTNTELWDIMDLLGEVIVTPFSLKIHRINFSPKRGTTGSLSAVLEFSPELDKLKKNIDSKLRTFNHHNKENNDSNHYHLHLGTIQKESPERIAHYFEANGEFLSSSFEVRDFVLAQMHQTPKRCFYTVEKRYLLA